MIFYLILCRSLTYAQRSARVLERAGISGHIMRTPRSIATEGCGYCVRISERKLSHALVVLRQNDLSPKQVYIHHENDTFREVEL